MNVYYTSSSTDTNYTCLSSDAFSYFTTSLYLSVPAVPVGTGFGQSGSGMPHGRHVLGLYGTFDLGD